MIIKIKDVKEHLKIDDDTEDNYLEALVNAAHRLFERQTGRILIPEGEPVEVDPPEIQIDDLIKQGILLTVGHWYENREATTSRTLSNIPLGVSACWGSYRYYNI